MSTLRAKINNDNVTKDLINYCNISPSTANLLLREFQKMNILNEVTGHKRNRIHKFSDYLEIFN